jgi:glutathione S-transferase
MALDATQEQAAKQWLQRNLPLGLNCPYCRGNQWTFGDVIVATLYTPGAFTLGGPVSPMLQVVCNRCAHVALFAAVPMGIVS